MSQLLPLTELRAALEYDPETGILRWRHRADMAKRWNSRWAGKEAGAVRQDGYRQLTLGAHHNLLAARVAWALAYGEDPGDDDIDHKNGDPSDNRLCNLRRVSRALNIVNTRSRGIWPKGVYRKGNRFVAQTKIAGEVQYLGCFGTPEEAHLAYLTAVNTHFGEGAYLRG